ncbi:MAG TPA: hypothetical protein VFP59_05755 [Candidatus Angelobacter sp.]|nr:hypothetical protein [Candidatus Angelobacter sp.]
MPLFLFIILSLNSMVFPSPAVDGVKIVTRQVTGGFTDLRTEYLTPDRMRNEWQTRAGEWSGPPMASIVQRGQHDHVYVMDLQAHEYVTYETDSLAGPVRSQSKPVASSGGTLQILTNSVDTGERKKFFGRIARHIITRERRIPSPGACSLGSESQTDGWYLDASSVPEWSQPKSGYGVVIASVVAAEPATNCQDKMDKIEVHHTGVELGFPVKVTTTVESQVPGRNGKLRMLASTWHSEILELNQGPLDPALFQVPANFRQVASLKSWIPALPPGQELTGWEWLKAKLEEFFR